MQKRVRIILNSVLGVIIFGSLVGGIGHLWYYNNLIKPNRYDSIAITSDADFSRKYHFLGKGTKSNPYRLEGLEMYEYRRTGSISIRDTTVFFVIRDCILGGKDVGISINNVANDTCTIEGNTISYASTAIKLRNTTGILCVKNKITFCQTAFDCKNIFSSQFSNNKASSGFSCQESSSISLLDCSFFCGSSYKSSEKSIEYFFSLFFTGCKDLTIQNCYLDYYCLSLSWCQDVTFVSNNLTSCYDDHSILGCANVNMSSNFFSQYGFFDFSSCSSVLFDGNTILERPEYAQHFVYDKPCFRVDDCSKFVLTNNTLNCALRLLDIEELSVINNTILYKYLIYVSVTELVFANNTVYPAPPPESSQGEMVFSKCYVEVTTAFTFTGNHFQEYNFWFDLPPTLDYSYFANNTVNGKPLLIFYQQHNQSYSLADCGALQLYQCSNLLLNDLSMAYSSSYTFEQWYYYPPEGILLFDSTNVTVCESSFNGWDVALLGLYCYNLSVTNSTFTDCQTGCWLSNIKYGLISWNTFNNCTEPITQEDCKNIAIRNNTYLLPSFPFSLHQSLPLTLAPTPELSFSLAFRPITPSIPLVSCFLASVETFISMRWVLFQRKRDSCGPFFFLFGRQFV